MNCAVEDLSEKDNEMDRNCLMERLRKENIDQFFTLVRMHLSFVVDINTDDSVDGSTDKPKPFRWGFNKKCKNTPTSAPASAPIKTSGDSSITDEGISKVYELIDFLVKEENVKQEGIFRRTGSLSRQQELKQLMMSGSPLGLDEGRFSVHDCASVLKGFLAELPQPLLMDQYYSTYCTLSVQYPATADWCESRLLKALQLLLLLLSPLHRSLLRRLLSLLRVTAAHEGNNRMSPDTLATMFTPHLLCPRQLSPETLHTDAVSLAPLVSFMIRHARQLFVPPAPLATDVAAYFTLRARRKAMSPTGELDDSISDRTAASTVYTFVDRHRSGAENSGNPTDAALAQLYAHIQALPESQHKRRLVKQFNRHNGCGTPIQVQRTGKVAGSKSIGESIKRHIFNKGLLNKTPKKSTNTEPSVEKSSFSKEKLQFPSEQTRITEVSHKGIVLKNFAQKMANAECEDGIDYESDGSEESTRSESGLLDRANKHSPKFISEPNLSLLDEKIAEETPKNTKPRRLFRSKGVPASHKKYSSKKNGNIRSTPTCVSCVSEGDSSASEDDIDEQNIQSDVKRLSRQESPKRCDQSPKDKSCDTSDDKIRLKYLTSTPGVSVPISERVTTPHFSNFRRASMSPITKSTQKLPKAMQESIMTPRSRKPLIITTEQRDNSLVIDTRKEDPESLDNVYGSPKNDSDFVSSDESNRKSCNNSSLSGDKITKTPGNPEDSGSFNKRRDNLSNTSDECPSTSIDSEKIIYKTPNEMSPFYLKEIKTKSLTEPFREYLLSRSVLTATPVDLSLVDKSVEEHIIEDGISDSLMYCLDGNVPSEFANISTTDIKEVTNGKDDSNIRSPLRNINNCLVANSSGWDKSPRKRSAVYECIDNIEECTSSKKKSPRQNKENVSEKEMDTSLWETDL